MIGLGGAIPVGRTLAAGLIGDPVAHSLSPVIHNAAYAALGLDWCYKAFLVRDGDVTRALASAAARGMRGLSVTTPHKVAAAAACDERSAAVERNRRGEHRRAGRRAHPGREHRRAGPARRPRRQVVLPPGGPGLRRGGRRLDGPPRSLPPSPTPGRGRSSSSTAPRPTPRPPRRSPGRPAGSPHRVRSPRRRSSSRRPRSASPASRGGSRAAGRRSPTTSAPRSSPSTSSTPPPSPSSSPWRAPRGPGCATASACSSTRRPTRWRSSRVERRRSRRCSPLWGSPRRPDPLRIATDGRGRGAGAVPAAVPVTLRVVAVHLLEQRAAPRPGGETAPSSPSCATSISCWLGRSSRWRRRGS